jgi:hypothetical protein
MRRTLLLAIALLPLSILLIGAVPLVDPPPLAVPQGLKAKDVSRGVRMGLAERGWLINKETPKEIEATLLVRKHTVKIAVAYDTSTVQIKYLDSTNLDYGLAKDGQTRVIHKKYPAWIQNTLTDISRNLQLVSIEQSK